MKNKFNKFMAFAALFILLAGISDYLIDGHNEELNNYFTNSYQDNVLLDKQIKEHCILPDEIKTIQMSEEGLNGECGFRVGEFDYQRNCFKFHTFGEEINWNEVAIKEIERLENKPQDYIPLKSKQISYSSIKIMRFLFLIGAFFCTLIAIIKGFKWNKSKLKPGGK
ncbi:MAG: hypothetical protein KKA62_04425 [Nanoarchaeota archaeon]|nr:hypothetical protein [Nanoarchaeota archaeon]MBU1977166.1 hypothetical protein [Nanoarchaeota archaeon]